MASAAVSRDVITVRVQEMSCAVDRSVEYWMAQLDEALTDTRLTTLGRLVKRHLVCKRWTIEKADENSNGIPWFVLHRPNSDKLRFHLPSLPWHWFDA